MTDWAQRVAVLATSFRRVGFGRLGGYVIPPDDVAAMAGLRDALGADDLVFVGTCNRVECYVVLPEEARDGGAALLAAAQQFFAARGAQVRPETFFARTGRAAIDHLFTVASSLDSLVVGETEISGQIRRATDRARSAGLCGKELAGLVDRAIACARRVRHETKVGSTPVSVASIALAKIRKHFGKAGPNVTVIVGVGDMSKKVALALKESAGEVLVVNRTRARAEAFCAEHGGTALSLDEFKAAPPTWIDLVFTATSSNDAVVDLNDLRPALDARERSGEARPLVVVDLGLPRDVDRAVDAHEGTVVVAMEHLEALSALNQEHLEVEVRAAREIVAGEVGLVAREERLKALAAESAEKMLAARLAHLSEGDRDAVLRFATSLAGRIARQPLDL